ncbi:MAG TPA: hypothetical protein VL404_05785 [Candidatus Eisenbacteria bacterium]|nr:hypothetical protein [Candidatus Eisenbacteria bacterium]
MIVKSLGFGAFLILVAPIAASAEEQPAAQKQAAPPAGATAEIGATEFQLDAYFFSAKPATTPELMTDYLQELDGTFQYRYEKIQKRRGRHFTVHAKPRPLKAGEPVGKDALDIERNGNYLMLVAEGQEGQEAVRTILSSKLEPAVVFLLDAPDPQTLSFPDSTGRIIHYVFYKGGARSMLAQKAKDARFQNIIVPDFRGTALSDPSSRKLILDTQAMGINEAFQSGRRQQESGITLPPTPFEEPAAEMPAEPKKEKKA